MIGLGSWTLDRLLDPVLRPLSCVSLSICPATWVLLNISHGMAVSGRFFYGCG